MQHVLFIPPIKLLTHLILAKIITVGQIRIRIVHFLNIQMGSNLQYQYSIKIFMGHVGMEFFIDLIIELKGTFVSQDQ